MGSTNLADGMGLALVNKSQCRFNGMPVILNSPLLPGVAVFRHPALKLMSEGGRVRAQHHSNTEANFIAYRLRHAQCVGVGRSMTLQRFGRRGEIRAVNKDQIGPPYALKGTSGFKEQTLAIEVKVVVQNRTVIDHAAPSNSVDEKAPVAEQAVPIHRRHGHHVGVASIGDNALAVGPHLNGQTVSSVRKGGAPEAGIKLGCSRWKAGRDGFQVERTVKLERNDDRAHFCDQPAVVHTHAKQEFLGSGTGGFNAMRAVDDDATFFIDDQGRPWAFHRLDDHAAVALAAHFSDDRVMIQRRWADEANQLVFNANVN